MTVSRIDNATIMLDGVCPLEDVEPLFELLLVNPKMTVDWRSCDAAHGGIIQLLLAAGVSMRGPPRGEFLREMVNPLFSRL